MIFELNHRPYHQIAMLKCKQFFQKLNELANKITEYDLNDLLVIVIR